MKEEDSPCGGSRCGHTELHRSRLAGGMPAWAERRARRWPAAARRFAADSRRRLPGRLAPRVRSVVAPPKPGLLGLLR